MKCPVCPTANLIMTERQGIEIDYCPECRGVWLDRGELDKIIERANAQAVAPPAKDKESYPPSPVQPANPTSYDHAPCDRNERNGHSSSAERGAPANDHDYLCHWPMARWLAHWPVQ